MPAQPPRFRPPGWTKRKAWTPSRSVTATPRKRGRAGQRDRAAVLLEEPFCRACLAAGRERRTEIIDHIVPLAWGGSDERDNKQGLCRPCHDAKSAGERASTRQGQRGTAHPQWIEPPACPVTVVCGPPCAGKSTYVRSHAGPGDIVICLDTILRGIDPGYVHWAEIDDRTHLAEALRIRNRMLGDLKRARGCRMAWLIVGAPTAAEREWWRERLNARIVLLQPDQQELERRAMEHGTPGAIDGIRDWIGKARLPWEMAFRRARRRGRA